MVVLSTLRQHRTARCVELAFYAVVELKIISPSHGHLLKRSWEESRSLHYCTAMQNQLSRDVLATGALHNRPRVDNYNITCTFEGTDN